MSIQEKTMMEEIMNKKNKTKKHKEKKTDKGQIPQKMQTVQILTGILLISLKKSIRETHGIQVPFVICLFNQPPIVY